MKSEDSSEGKKTKKRPLKKLLTSLFQSDQHTYDVQYSTAQYSTVQYSTVQYSTVQYSTVLYIVRVLS